MRVVDQYNDELRLRPALIQGERRGNVRDLLRGLVGLKPEDIEEGGDFEARFDWMYLSALGMRNISFGDSFQVTRTDRTTCRKRTLRLLFADFGDERDGDLSSRFQWAFSLASQRSELEPFHRMLDLFHEWDADAVSPKQPVAA